MSDYDLVVLGSGPGGYVAAIRAGQLGMKVALVEKDQIGGVCLNWGCIPSKALLRNAEVLRLFQHSEDFGITVDNLKFDFSKAIDRSRNVVQKLTTGINFLLKKNNVEKIDGMGSLKDSTHVEIGGGTHTLPTKNVILATGARPRPIPSLHVDRRVVITSREALEMRDVPSRVVIVGGGATGVEFAYLYSTYGADVTIVELLPNLLPSEDRDISIEMEKAFAKQGISIMTGSTVDKVQIGSSETSVFISNTTGTTELLCDKILSAVGMQGNIENIGIENIGIETNKSYIAIDDKMETNVPGIYAIGDVTGKLLLAHVASAQAITAVETIAGLNPPKLDYQSMPRATYCHPQVASFGFTESQARELGHDVKIGTFPFSASGKAIALGETEGVVKLVIDTELGDLLGAHMIGPEVTELLGELSMTKLLEGTNKELGWLVHPHPTISEVVKEAALSADGEAIHV